MIEASLEHAAVCCNKATNCMDNGPRNTFAFGCSKSVVLYQAKPLQNAFTYNFHQEQVEAIQWFRTFKTDCSSNFAKSEYLLSGDNGGLICCSRFTTSCSPLGPESLQTKLSFSGHDDAIRCLDGIQFDKVDGSAVFLIASSSADSKVKIFHALGSLENLESSNCQVIEFNMKFVLGLKIHILPRCGPVPVLACACDDFKIRLYSCDGSMHFTEKVALQGHEDWVRSVSFVDFSADSLLLASTAQDYTIRIWKIKQEVVVDASESSNKFLEVKKEKFSVDNHQSESVNFSVFIDTVLEGHESIVYSATWNVSKYHAGESKKLQLLTASLDKVIILWEYDESAKMWVDTVRVGESGGNTLGFYNALFCHDNSTIVAQSYNGSLYCWDLDENDKWQAGTIVSGHMSSVNDLDWHSSGNFLVSTSKDQTTRLFSRVLGKSMWHELARPQIHGFDMQCISMLHNGHFVSGGDEKVVRVFRASKNFLENYSSLTGKDLVGDVESAPQGAAVPALGLSNKAVFSIEEQSAKEEIPKSQNDQYIDNLFQPLTMIQPPSETDLLQNTLWPEVTKLYGHVYEIYAVASSKCGRLFASAAKSSQQQHAGIFVWSTTTWQSIATLGGHSLTVTRIEFSPDGKFILSVSRDRKWVLHEVVYADENAPSFKLIAQSDKKSGHSRIIWDCSWSHDSQTFATGSRDKKVMLWGNMKSVERLASMNFGEPVNSVGFSRQPLSKELTSILAVGLESGKIKLCSVNDAHQISELVSFDQHLSHSLTVHRLKWKPQLNDDKTACLASCGLDHQLKLFKISAK